MTDYISRADAIAVICKDCDGIEPYMCGAYLDHTCPPIKALEALPSADAVSREDTVTLNSPISIQADMVAVVRCKDCRYRFYDKYNDCYMCDRHEYGESFEDDDFCSWGERREP